MLSLTTSSLGLQSLGFKFYIKVLLWYIYTMEYYSAIKKSAFESVFMRWMELEPIIHSEVSQKEKDSYHILMHVYGI